MATRITVKALDHVVLTVADVAATVAFYVNLLGMRHEVFASPKNPEVERYVSPPFSSSSLARPWERAHGPPSTPPSLMSGT
jgi:catechol 2,3-dioxygenase-like lactoylglutathione lyase family enzyme